MKTNKTHYKTPTIEVSDFVLTDVLTVSGNYETGVSFTSTWGGLLK